MSKIKTRTSVNPDVDFPLKDSEEWPFVGHLLNHAEVIGGVRDLIGKNYSVKDATYNIAKKIETHWIDRNVWPKSQVTIQKLLTKVFDEFTHVRKLITREDQNVTQSTVQRYTALTMKKESIFDVYCSDETEQGRGRRSRLESETGIKMSTDEEEYLKNQLNTDIPRNSAQKRLCYPTENDLDPRWEEQKKKEMKRKHYYEEKRKEEKESREVEVEDFYASDNGESDKNSGSTEDECDVMAGPSKKRTRSYVAHEDDKNDSMPVEFRHIRDGERKVKDDVYLALTDLMGNGFSSSEALYAVMKVSNRMFKRNFKLLADKENSEIDQDTLPDVKMVHRMAERVEAHGLDAIQSEIEQRHKAGDTITHASDSTTKKFIGKFAVSGLHVNKELALPLPTVPVAGEARSEIAEQVALGFQILAAAAGKTPEEIYKNVDQHLTDSVGHNKKISEDVAQLFNLDTRAGQIFCSTHTNLGFCKTLNDAIHQIEEKHGINTFISSFLVDMEYESKNGSVFGQFVDQICRLCGLELSYKPWCVGPGLKMFCNDNDVQYEMFLYKDERFGCFPKASAVVLYSCEIIQDYLYSHPDIDNRLACIVRDIFDQEYVKLCLTVVAAFGLQIVEPFHSATIQKSSTHNSLKVFFGEMHRRMGDKVTNDFFSLEAPWLHTISMEMHQEILKGYKPHVVEAITIAAEMYTDECVELANYIMPQLQTVLARQRRDYGLSEQFPAEFPIENLSEVARKNAPTHNLGMESQCALVDYRSKKNRNLEATSRAIIIKGTEALREKFGCSFRDYRDAANEVKAVKLEWKKKQDVFTARKTSKKQENNLKIEGRVLKQLEKLKERNGPFTNSEDIEVYLASNESPESKKGRMKMEIQYARDTSRSLPRSNPIFRIRTSKVPGKKSRDLTAEEFGSNLKTLLDKKTKAANKGVSINEFVETLKSMA